MQTERGPVGHTGPTGCFRVLRGAAAGAFIACCLLWLLAAVEGDHGTGAIVFGTGFAPAKRAHFGMRFAPFPDPYQENCQDGRRRMWTDVERSRTESPKPT